ncbi:MAG: 4-(cytidine 5'-diphospho)-2-C-methyl-D-erythritol kinase [Tissierellia bacterium]|nr:4-(cytidine 5'-diphospho)-2-C-methyl-D-erythritol kinase [Tissierellia bacterium]
MEKAFGKINLSLKIVGKRPDGYHNIDTIMVPVDLYDEIYISPWKDELLLSVDGDVPSDSSNLLHQVWENLLPFTTVDPGIKVHLKKNIPVGAGLGGGSSDAALFLKRLLKRWDIHWNKDQIKAFCEKIGADVYYFMEEQTVRATGIGTDFKPLPDFNGIPLLLMNPGVSISTKKVYEEMIIGKSQDMDDVEKALLSRDFKGLRECVFNDMEETSFRMAPEIKEIKEKVNAFDGISLMSGSGATVFSLFKTVEERDRAFDEMKDKVWFIHKGFTGVDPYD